MKGNLLARTMQYIKEVSFYCEYSRSCRGCFKFGSLAGLFYGVQKLNAVANAEASLGDTIIAAAVTGGVAGAFSEHH